MTATSHMGDEAAAGDEFGDALAAVGIGMTEAAVYRAVLRGVTTNAGLAAAVGIAPSRARRALGALHSAGLLSRQPGSRARLVPAAPDTAIAALILRRQEELERCRIAASELLTEFEAHRHRHTAELIEVITGPEAIYHRFVQLTASARREVLMFDAPPYIHANDNPMELAALARGVAWRAVYTPEALDEPDRVRALRDWQAAGEQARMSPALPMKLAIADEQHALLPLRVDTSVQDTTAIVVHRCSLLNTLVLLFEQYWEAALPLVRGELPAPGSQPGDGAGGRDLDAELLRLLGAGLKDEAIARYLGVSLRTVRRRIGHLMVAAKVTSRFQLGVLAGRESWI